MARTTMPEKVPAPNVEKVKTPYDRDRGRRFKRWWAGQSQKGPPRGPGELIHTPATIWTSDRENLEALKKAR